MQPEPGHPHQHGHGPPVHVVVHAAQQGFAGFFPAAGGEEEEPNGDEVSEGGDEQ